MINLAVQYHLHYIFLICILVEIWLIQKHQAAYSWRESMASLGVAIGHGLAMAWFKLIPLTVYSWVWHYRLFALDANHFTHYVWLFLGIEFCYYWYHRSAHRVRWFWATHSVHHSPTYFNLSAAYRLGWTGGISGHFMFFLPLAALGFSPLEIMIGLSLNLLYQFWLHTELVPKLGVLEWVLNTPSHHRVHHASNACYCDRNYGGILIIFDRLFGTFGEELPAVPCRYGLTVPVRSHHPVTIALSGWRSLWQDLAQVQNGWERWRYLIMPPGDRGANKAQ